MNTIENKINEIKTLISKSDALANEFKYSADDYVLDTRNDEAIEAIEKIIDEKIKFLSELLGVHPHAILDAVYNDDCLVQLVEKTAKRVRIQKNAVNHCIETITKKGYMSVAQPEEVKKRIEFYTSESVNVYNGDLKFT